MQYPKVHSYQITDIAAGTSRSATMPSGISAGDCLIWCIGGDVAITMSTGPSGWTLMDTGGSLRDHVYAKIADGTETGSIGYTIGASVGGSDCVICVKGNLFGTLANVTAFANGTPSSTASPDAPSLNPSTWDVEPTLWLILGGRDRANGSTLSAGASGYTTEVNYYGSGINNFSWYIGSKQSMAASEDPPTYSISVAENGLPNTMAIRAATNAGLNWSAP